MNGRMVKLYRQLELPNKKTCAHRRVDQFLIRIMIESFEQIIQDGSHRVPVCCGPLTPCLLLPDTARDSTRVRCPEETFSVGDLDPWKLELHAR